MWFITGYDDVVKVLKDERFVNDARKHLPPEIVTRYMPLEPDPAWATISQNLISLDPPDHTRLRSLVHKAFTPQRIRDLEPRIESIAQDLLEKMQTKNSGDLIDDFAFPLPITVIAEMIGVEKERQKDFRRWSQALILDTDASNRRIMLMELVQYINGLIEERRHADTGDILSALVRLEEDGDALSHTEVISMVFLLLIAGHETTGNLIANGMLLLFQHPEQMTQLQQNRSLMQTAIEEILRFNGPVETATLRFAAADVEISGVTIPMGDKVKPALMAANRDPEIFEQANVFDITRNPNPHIAFGQGIHYCLGAPLARMEAMIAFNALLDRLPAIQLDTDIEALEWNASLLIHGMKALPVRW